MDVLLQQIINGLVLGSMYALALGYTMVYGIIGLINFAHGDVLMIGALTSWTIIVQSPRADARHARLGFAGSGCVDLDGRCTAINFSINWPTSRCRNSRVWHR